MSEQQLERLMQAIGEWMDDDTEKSRRKLVRAYHLTRWEQIGDAEMVRRLTEEDEEAT